MQMRERDEKKRSLVWRMVVIASTLVILFVAGYFVVDALVGNPLEGEWVAEEKGYYLEISDDNEMTVEGTFDGQEMEFDLEYSLNKAEKLITIKGDEDGAAYVTAEFTTEETSETAGTGSITFSYSLGSKTLTLTDCEYGTEFVFTRK